MTKYGWDKLIAIIFLLLTVVFIVVCISYNGFFEWVFDRHHNQWSWYIRPVFLIPYCYFAYKRSWSGLSITVFCLFTSMFWFNQPETTTEHVKTFLQFEKDCLYSEWNYKKLMLIITVPISFAALALSFWKRSLFMGLSVLVLMATGKIAWSILSAGESGTSIILPAIIGLIICGVLIFWGYRKLQKKDTNK